MNMPRRTLKTLGFGITFLFFAMVFAWLPVDTAMAQVVSSVVGGVAIDEGAMRTATKQENAQLARDMAQLVNLIPEGLDQESPYRKVSLKMLNAEMERCIAEERDFTPAVCFLGGLTAIKYVVADPENNDVLLIGPAEGWRVDETGSVVGKRSGSPVLLLQDLLTVFRAWDTDRPRVITCSIDPTPDAVAKIQQILRTQARPGEERARAYALEQANGNHVVTIEGVPDTSRFAKVLAAADYKMKRIGLGHEKSPNNLVPSYVSLINARTRNASAMPRFWFAPEYETIHHDSKELIWDIGGLKVKTLTEEEYFDVRNGRPVSTGRVDAAAKRWCDMMNRNFERLASADPVFGDLKNCMDVAMVVALIHRENLLGKANCRLPAFSQSARLRLPTYPAPKTVAAKSIINRNIVACGGVEINPFQKLEDCRLDSKLDALEQTLTVPTGETWYTNTDMPKYVFAK